jgi:hypothetical protein
MGWTADTVFTHFTALGRARDLATQAALVAQSTRLDGMNEFRESLKDSQATFATRVEVDAIKETQRTFITRGEVYALCATAASVGGAIGAAVGHLFR